MHVTLFRALRSANIADDAAGKVVHAFEEHIDMAVADAMKHYEDRITAMQTVLETKLDTGLKNIEASIKGLDGKLTGIDGKFAGIDAKFAGIDAKFAGIDAKFAAVEGRLDGMKTSIDRLTAFIIIEGAILAAVGVATSIMKYLI